MHYAKTNLTHQHLRDDASRTSWVLEFTFNIYPDLSNRVTSLILPSVEDVDMEHLAF